ncbi:HAG group protein [Dictyostelium discoideum AX4]|uniref:HAG group protein n=1 Tax=Dictyostelium discoideum TaxID=44689 RepID=Q54W72_DICDI|nr:HAG group protein [Dictyostelium discoideum AX4]EAL67539.1 HAG group protein [Dictyostelium discoideum AX4]|eukprot:XP_641520.1 HAG group protein [Dictyostelium discoideum AX4]
MEPIQDDFEIIPATRDDMQKVYDLIVELAEYEKLKHMVVGDVKDMEKWAFGEDPVIFINCGKIKSTGKIIAYSLHFRNYSTFLCKPGIYLEDIYVQPEYRGRGYGKKMLLYLSKLCYEKGYGRMEWQVLKWNKPSIDFYESLGAEPLNEWLQYRLVGDSLKKCAEKFDQLK